MNRTIVHVASYGNPARGSFIPALERLARAAAAQGDRVAVVAPTIENASWPASLAEAGVELRLIRTPWEAAIATRELSADIVHAHFSRYDVPVALAHATTGARIFWHVHSATIAAKHRDRLAPLKSFVKHRIVGARVEAMIAVAEPVARELLEWHVPPLKLHVIENGVDTDRFSLPTDAERASARGALGIAANERVLAFFDRSAVKGGATLREAMRELRGWRLLVVGGTSQSRAAFGEPPAVIPIERSHDTRQIYWAADALAFPSFTEAHPYVLIEALSCGLPVAASDILVNAEITRGMPGVELFAAGDAAGLRRSVAALPLGRHPASRALVRERFGIDRWTRRMMALYG